MNRSSWLFTVTALVLILLYALVPLMMLMDSSLAETLIMKNRPGLSDSELQFATVAVIIFTTAIHLLFMGLTLWLSEMGTHSIDRRSGHCNIRELFLLDGRAAVIPGNHRNDLHPSGTDCTVMASRSWRRLP